MKDMIVFSIVFSGLEKNFFVFQCDFKVPLLKKNKILPYDVPYVFRLKF